jgi:UPF0271 protein
MTLPSSIDINCDMGESFGNWRMGSDAEMFPFITSANIACGFHAGDPTEMRRSVRLAKRHGVAVGAHPGYRDLEGFGRRFMVMTPDEVADSLTYQIGALDAFLRVEDMELHHVKPHGAFFTLLRDDHEVGLAGARAIHALAPELIVYWPAPSLGIPFCEELRQLGHTVVGDIYPDLTYDKDGRVVIQRLIGDTDIAFAVAQVNRFLTTGEVATQSGATVTIDGASICLHGDGADAVELATAVRQAVLDAGVEVATVSR